MYAQLMRTIGTCLAVALCVFATSAAVRGDDQASLVERLQRSEAHKSGLAYHGEFIYTREIDEDHWEVAGRLYYTEDHRKRVILDHPAIFAGIEMMQTPEDVWATKIEKERFEEIEDIVKPLTWFLVFRHGDVLTVEDWPLLAQNYDISQQDDEERAGVPVLSIAIDPRHDNRPRAHVWLSEAHDLQVAYERYDESGVRIEAFAFQEISIGPFEEEGLWDVEGMICLTDDDDDDKDKDDKDGRRDLEDAEPSFEPLEAQTLPDGFVLHKQSSWHGRLGVTMRHLYSDGLARLSIYQRLLDEEDEDGDRRGRDDRRRGPEEGEVVDGTEDAKRQIKKYKRHDREIYFMDIDNLRISAVGDLPAETIIETLLSHQ